MMASSKIEWTDETWNPVSGCEKVSEGCRNCYAETIAHRFWGSRPFREVRCHPERLDAPVHWKKPRRVFVNSMSDLFHEEVPHEFLFRVFRIMAKCQRHTFQILTKRPKRMLDFCARLAYIDPGFNGHDCGMCSYWPNDPAKYPTYTRPLPNVWLGVSVEDQVTADKRIPILLRTPAAVRWISAEPLLGPVDLTAITVGHENWNALDRREAMDAEPGSPNTILDWVVLGGESGPQARPCNVDWIRSLVQRCRSETIPVFVKQVGSRPWSGPGNHPMHITDPKGGDPSEWPTDLRVREWPQ